MACSSAVAALPAPPQLKGISTNVMAFELDHYPHVRPSENRTQGLRTSANIARWIPLLIAIWAEVAFTAVFAVGQLQNATGDVATPIPGVGHDYIHNLSETVNPATGSLSVRIDIPVPPGRKITLPFALLYNSSGVNQPYYDIALQRPKWINFASQQTGTGWVYSIPSLTALSYLQTFVNNAIHPPTVNTCNWISNYMFQTVDSSRHLLGLSIGEHPGGGTNCGVGFSPPADQLTHFDSVYGSSTTNPYQGPVGYPAPVSVVDPHGTVYTFSNFLSTSLGPVYGVGNGNGFYAATASIEDRNGNVVLINSSSGAYTETDSTGRVAVSASAINGSTNTITVSGISSPYNIIWQSAGSNFTTGFQTIAPYCGAQIAANAQTSTVIQTLTLPNAQAYHFGYDTTYGLLNYIQYPSGATVNYTWGVNTLSEVTTWLEAGVQTPTICAIEYGVPAITKRIVSFDGVHPSLEQDFSYQTTWNGTGWQTKQTVVTTYDRVTSQSYQTKYNYSPVPLPRPPNTGSMYEPIPLTYVEQSVIQYADLGTTPLRTLTKAWINPYLIGCEIEAHDNAISGTWYGYQGGQLIDKKEYDYGQIAASSACGYTSNQVNPPPSTTPLRETTIAYQVFPTTPIFPAFASIIDRPSSVLVYGGSSKSEETDYFYDQSSVVSVGSLPSGTHDDTYYGISYNNRANLTKRVRKCFVGSINCPNDSATTYTNDITGQIRTITDPCGNATCSDMSGTNHATTYSYTDNPTGGNLAGNSNAYLTQVNYPTPANGAVQQESFSFDYSTGQLVSSTDRNGQVTSFVYGDALDRLTQANYPDGGQTLFSYNDSVPNPSVTTCKLLNGTAGATCNASNPPIGWIVSLSVMDGLGHPILNQLNSDPDGIDSTEITYDGSGRVWKQSNPHRSFALPTDGTTTTYYDALGRMCLTVPPDGTLPASSTCPTIRPPGDKLITYSGNASTFTDEAGKSRTLYIDGLGRLTKVLEDPTGLNYETDYGYDGLDNLTSVVQKGGSTNASNWRTRAFVYDSLSRLTSATNPEPGTVTYSYDANGNLVTKTALSPNQPAAGTATVTTSFSYDVLNRMTGKSYADTYISNPATAPVTYAYDGVTVSCPAPFGYGGPSTLGVGYRTGMCDAVGSKSWNYDKMGRKHTENQRLLNPVAPYSSNVVTIGGIPLLSSNTWINYYLNGDFYFVQYPSGIPTREFYVGESTAGRVTSAGDDLNHYLGAGTYTPAGALATGTVAAVSGLYNGNHLNNTYNSRQQPVTLSAATFSGTPIQSLTYNFNLGSADNGNVLQITNGLDNNRTQNFTYDTLNRIQSAYTTGPNWGENYSIDPWGNLYARSGVSGKTNYELLNCNAPNIRNQLSTCYTYDAAGNLIRNGAVTYTYDAENRLISTSGMSYLYDGDGTRIKKCTAGSTTGTCATNPTGTLYWWIGANVFAESDLGGNWTAAYGLIGGQIAARIDLPANIAHFYFRDFLGTTSIITDYSGSIQKQSDYYPYGGESFVLGSDLNRYKFTGKERDAESGLDNFGARYFGSSLGRFMTPDWSAKPQGVPYAVLDDPQSLNLYAYVRNNPLSRADLDGHNDYAWQKFKNWLHHNGWKTDAQVKGLNVAQTAANHVGSKDWAINGLNTSGKDVGHPQAFKPGQDKCNQFVGDTLAEAGKPRPEITDKKGNTRMPSAHELADPNVSIPGLSAPKPLSDAKPGDVIAQEHGNTYGHAGIVVFDSNGNLATVSANATGNYSGEITQNDWGFRPAGQNGESATDPAPVVREPQ